MEEVKPLVDKDYFLFKTEGKGGWTFAEITDIPMPKISFGMLRVKGKINNYEFSNVHLMPIGNGHVGLAIKAEIRKKIKKQTGDSVHIILYEDNLPTEIPEELILCLKFEEGVLERFETYNDSEKRAFVNWIYSAKTEQTRVDRIAKTIVMVSDWRKDLLYEIVTI